jgi:hypothetical protein
MTPVIGVVALAGLLVVQLHATGTTSYYFLKLLIGFELILGPVTAAVLASIVALRCPRRPIAPKTVVAALMVTTLTTQLFGYVAPTTAPMLRVRATASDAGGDLFLGPIADGILRAASSPPAAPSYAVEYLAMGGSRSYSAVHPASWFHALSSTSTHLSHERLVLLSVRVTDVEDAAPVVRSLLEQFPTARVVVDPRYFVALRDAVGPSLASGVLEWGADSPQALE